MVEYNDITVCMLHYNRPTVLAKTLPTYSNFKNIFLWDNNSELQNKIWMRAYCAKNKNVRPIYSDKNVGWPRAMNQMIIDSKTEWIMLTAEDMLLGPNFIETLNKLLDWKPNLEQIYVHTFDTMLFHKKTIAKIGWWDEFQPPVAPFWEDNDLYLRLHEYMGFSPGYVFPGEHIHGEERERKLKYASKKEDMERMDNISYFSNCRWGISTINFNIAEITRDHSYIAQYNKNVGESGMSYHLKKWRETGDEKDLLNKDCTFWQRILPERDPYPEITKQYMEKYL